MKTAEQLREHNAQVKKWNNAEETWMAYAASRHVPISGTFELTPRCNLSCKMCYIRLDGCQEKQIGQELTARQWIELGEQAAKAGTLYLLITGGEPFLRPDFPEIYKALSHMGFMITIYTNATLIDDEIQELLEQYPPYNIGVTLYGASRETYERVCGNPDAFDQTIAGLERLKKVKTGLQIHTTFIKDNTADMEDIYHLAQKYTYDYQINTNVHLSFLQTDTDVTSCRLSPREALDFEKNYIDFFSSQNQDRIDDAFYDEREKRTGYELPPVNIECLASKAWYSISWDGKMVGCNTFQYPYTEPLKEGFAEAWERLPGLLEKLDKPAECKECILDKEQACPNCPAMLYIETGSFEKVSPYLCEYAKEVRRRVTK